MQHIFQPSLLLPPSHYYFHPTPVLPAGALTSPH